MQPEKEDGNVEYKLKLLNKSSERIEKLASQMAYRCNEGGAECFYNLGVEDDGTMVGITEHEFKETVQTLKKAAEKNDYSVTLLSKTPVEDDKHVYEVIVREVNSQSYINIKVAVAGSVDSGKSTTMGVLTTGINDDGRGRARLAVFNFPHEVATGRTSSVAQHILGFDEKGEVVNYKGSGGKMTWPEIVKASSKVITLFDLAGHEKYLRTTITGLASSAPEVCLITVGANRGVLRMTIEHIFLCVTLKIPFAIVLTKVDVVEKRQKVYEEAIASIKKIVRSPGIRRLLVPIDNDDDVLAAARNVYSYSVVPLFRLSNVTGEGLDHVRKFLNLLRAREKSQSKSPGAVCRIDHIFSVPGVGTVVGGHLLSGTISVGDKVLLGPNRDSYTETSVRSIQCKRVPLTTVSHETYVCLSLKKISRENVRVGNVVISADSEPLTVRSFIADISVLKVHSTTIRCGYEPVLHASGIRQSVKLIRIIKKTSSRSSSDDMEFLRAGDKARVEFLFRFRSEYLPRGTSILLCEGRTKVIGNMVR